MAKHTFFPILALIFSTFLVGCTVQEKYWDQTTPIFMDETAKQHIKSTRVIVSIDQDQRLGIPVLGQRTSHQYYGVVGKLAESGMLRFQNDLSETLKNNLRQADKAAYKFDIGTQFRQAVENALTGIDWLKATNFTSQTDTQISDTEAMVKTQDEDAMLLIDNRYLMAIDFSRITVFSYVTLYAHEDTLVNMAQRVRPYESPPTLYKHLFSFEYRYAGQYTGPEDALAGWSANNGDMVTQALQASIGDLTKQITEDFTYVTSK